jgi:23S rRNA pseudouridine1911/1915/1917 synthase
LRFRHPITGEELDLRAPMPDDLRRSIAAIGGMPELVSQEDPLDVFRFFHVDDPNLPIDDPLADA